MRFSIFKRLAIGYAAIMILVIFMGVYVTLKLIQIKRLTHDAALVDSAIVRQVDQLFDTLFTQVSFEEKYLISKDQDFYNKFWEVEENFLKDIGKLESHIKNIFRCFNNRSWVWIKTPINSPGNIIMKKKNSSIRLIRI
jgi:two-component system sensor histidine kinase GlrK